MAGLLRLRVLERREGETEPHVPGPVISLAILSTVADLAAAASPQPGLATASHAADVNLLLDHLGDGEDGGT